MENVNTFLFVLALFLALVIMVIFGVCMKVRQEKIQAEIDEDLVASMLYSKISHVWKFLEEISDELFSDKDQELQCAFRRLFKESYETKEYQVIFVKNFMLAFEEQGLISSESVIYSEVTLGQHPYLFRSLPEWKRTDCDFFINFPNNFPKEKKQEIIRIKKISEGCPTKKRPPKNERNSFFGLEPLSALN